MSLDVDLNVDGRAGSNTRDKFGPARTSTKEDGRTHSQLTQVTATEQEPSDLKLEGRDTDDGACTSSDISERSEIVSRSESEHDCTMRMTCKHHTAPPHQAQSPRHHNPTAALGLGVLAFGVPSC